MENIGQCGVCGTNGNVRNSRGVPTCATCQKIFGYVNNHPERIVKAAKALGKVEELAGLLGSGASDAELVRERDELRAELDRANATVAERERELEKLREGHLDAVNAALLEWARSRMAEGKLSLRVEVMDADTKVVEVDKEG